ncbi:hypothetical protein [Sinosporangium siamense]|uniref:Uncharacterized protein n=1 Tax=Sinosporangium siamense TaxID=1367973 RepID=A0A919RFG7_9ACTN|nr:hypothetical protein [Sinosporangium siamense]GII92935.1 hypothetical protein Ssi02_31660 [Sinosporangium siamense]
MTDQSQSAMPPPIDSEGHHHHARIGSWSILCTWDEARKKSGPSQMVITAAPDGDPQEIAKGITPGVLRAIPLGDLIKEQRMTVQDATATLREAGVKAAAQVKRMVDDNPRPGRAGRPPVFYAIVASAYTCALVAQEERPVAWLAEQIGADRKTVENWLRLAREEYGMLSPATHGVAGGVMTPKAEQVLREAADVPAQ